MLFNTLLVIISVSGVLSQEKWGVTYTAQRICAVKESSVNMSCTYSYPTSHTVQKTFWVSPQNSLQDLSKDPEYSQRVEYLGKQNSDCAFRINQLRITDSGTYGFRFLTASNKFTGKPGVTLEVTDLQVMVNPDTVREGQSVRLTCSTTCTLTGSPAFIWYRDGSPLSFTGQSHQFTASSEDRSHYTCAVKGYELRSPAVALNVRYPPKSVSVSMSSSGKIVEGSSVTLTCSSDANPPVQKYTWYKNNRAVSSLRASERRYTINKINSGDAGEYYCEAGNGIGTNRSPSERLDVQYPPKSVAVSEPSSGEVVEGSSVTLTCSSDANPAVQKYTWYKNNIAVSSLRASEQRYTINEIKSGHAGEYYCEAENAIGTKRSLPKRLYVLYPPKSVSVSVSPSGEIKEGTSVTLTCSSSDANPSVESYAWYNNRADLSWRRSSYTIKNITLQDAGEYYCEAKNAIGTNRSLHKSLDVQYPPKSVSVSVSPSGEIVEGRLVTLTCSSDGNPPVQKYTWYKKTGFTFSRRGSERSYTINEIKSGHAGEYYCEAKNVIGTERSPPKHLDVQYPLKSVSVSVSPSGEIKEGSSVTLTCSSDANPPVQNYTWFKKNKTGVWQAGSGLSLNFSNFRSWNRGQYYCEARNKHGVQNSTAVSINIEGGQSLIAGAAVGVAAILAVVFLGVVCLRRRRKSTNETEGDRQGNKSPIYGNVSGMAMSHTGTQGTDRDDGEVPLYASVQPANTRNQEQVLYSTVQKPLPQCEEGVQYASIQFRPSSAAPRSPAPSVKEDCVLYSTLRKLDM